MKYIKLYEQFNDIDPYNEEIWEDDILYILKGKSDNKNMYMLCKKIENNYVFTYLDNNILKTDLTMTFKLDSILKISNVEIDLIEQGYFLIDIFYLNTNNKIDIKQMNVNIIKKMLNCEIEIVK